MSGFADLSCNSASESENGGDVRIIFISFSPLSSLSLALCLSLLSRALPLPLRLSILWQCAWLYPTLTHSLTHSLSRFLFLCLSFPLFCYHSVSLSDDWAPATQPPDERHSQHDCIKAANGRYDDISAGTLPCLRLRRCRIRESAQ